MRIEDTVRETVVFLGFEDSSPQSGGIQCVGTAFLVGYKNAGYLITAKHVAQVFGDNPFLIRLNKTDGSSQNIPADEVIWHYHPDDNVDIAAIPFEVPNLINNRIFDATYISDSMILTNEIREQFFIGIGDQCYTVGLFRFLAGQKRNLPIVHTGNIALLPDDEKIPVIDWDDSNGKKVRYVEGYLVESQSIAGLSGSPVLVRFTIDIPVMALNGMTLRARVPSFQLFLLGIWQSAWKAPPSELYGLDNTNVPVGVGVVIPASRITEVLELPILSEKRRTKKPIHIEYAASPDVAKPIIPENPQHKEDFNSLVSAAAKKKLQDD
ncbi:MAG: hypothetical protein ACLP2P_16580 [Desulfobaccales bacterium]